MTDNFQEKIHEEFKADVEVGPIYNQIREKANN